MVHEGDAVDQYSLQESFFDGRKAFDGQLSDHTDHSLGIHYITGNASHQDMTRSREVCPNQNHAFARSACWLGLRIPRAGVHILQHGRC